MEKRQLWWEMRIWTTLNGCGPEGHQVHDLCKECQTFQRTWVTVSPQLKINSRKKLKFLYHLNHFQEQSVSLSEYMYFISCTSTGEIYTKHDLQPESSYADTVEHETTKMDHWQSPWPSVPASYHLASLSNPQGIGLSLGALAHRVPSPARHQPHIEEALENYLWNK